MNEREEFVQLKNPLMLAGNERKFDEFTSLLANSGRKRETRKDQKLSSERLEIKYSIQQRVLVKQTLLEFCL